MPLSPRPEQTSNIDRYIMIIREFKTLTEPVVRRRSAAASVNGLLFVPVRELDLKNIKLFEFFEVKRLMILENVTYIKMFLFKINIQSYVSLLQL